MSITAQRLFEQALGRGDEERAELALLILQSLEPADADAGEAWAAELKRRIEALDSGVVETIPWLQVREKLLQHTGGTD